MIGENTLFFCDWLFVLLLSAFGLYNLTKITNNQRPIKIATFSFLLIGIIGCSLCIVSSDYFGYKKVMERIVLYSMSLDVEPIYWSLSELVNYKVILFRLVLFAVYFPVSVILFRILDTPQTLTYTVFFVLLYFSVASIVRSSVGDIFMWLGIVSLYKRTSILTIFLFLITSVIGIILHKSAFMVLFLFIISYFPLKKAWMQLSILLLPLAIIIIRIVIPIIFAAYFENSTYAEAKNTISTVGNIKNILSTLFTLCFGAFLLLKSRKYCSSQLGIKLYRVYYWAYYASVAFLFSGASRFIGERLYAHAAIPMLYLVTLLFWKGSFRTKKETLAYMVIFALIVQLGILVVWAYHRPYLLSNVYI